jgi:hypothetical protein
MSCHRLSPRPNVSTALLTLSALVLWLVLPCGAQAETHAKAKTKLHAKTHARRASGLFVALDPVTHLPTTPSEAQKRAFAERAGHDALLAPTAPLRVERLPGGGEIIQLNGRFQSYSIARRDSRGRFVTDCAPDPATARNLLTKKPAPPSKTVWEEK